MKRKQSASDQIKRIEKFTCPIHGVTFAQSRFSAEGVKFSIGKCTRNDCEIMAVVDYEEKGGLTIRQLITAEQVHALESLWYDLFKEFTTRAATVIEKEVERLSRDPNVQPPVYASDFPKAVSVPPWLAR